MWGIFPTIVRSNTNFLPISPTKIFKKKIEFLKYLRLLRQNINPHVFEKIINECQYIVHPTSRELLDRAEHIWVN